MTEPRDDTAAREAARHVFSQRFWAATNHDSVGLALDNALDAYLAALGPREGYPLTDVVRATLSAIIPLAHIAYPDPSAGPSQEIVDRVAAEVQRRLGERTA